MSGIDCSGLVMRAHQAIGVKLAHYSGSIGSGGRAVAKADRQPGDVVCYSGHVGIYVGNGMMIHAPQTGDVVRVVAVYGSHRPVTGLMKNTSKNTGKWPLKK